MKSPQQAPLERRRCHAAAGCERRLCRRAGYRSPDSAVSKKMMIHCSNRQASSWSLTSSQPHWVTSRRFSPISRHFKTIIFHLTIYFGLFHPSDKAGFETVNSLKPKAPFSHSIHDMTFSTLADSRRLPGVCCSTQIYTLWARFIGGAVLFLLFHCRMM